MDRLIDDSYYNARRELMWLYDLMVALHGVAAGARLRADDRAKIKRVADYLVRCDAWLRWVETDGKGDIPDSGVHSGKNYVYAYIMAGFVGLGSNEAAAEIAVREFGNRLNSFMVSPVRQEAYDIGRVVEVALEYLFSGWVPEYRNIPGRGKAENWFGAAFPRLQAPLP